MFPTFISILDIQSWWEVPSIAHFCSLFRTAFNLLDFDIEDLEEALLTDGTEETSWLQELIVRLLSGCLPNNEISTFNYQMFLRRLFRQKCQEHDQYNPFNTDVDFQLLPLRTKVDILHALCDFRLDADDVLDQLKNLEADSLRVEPLGYDSNESAYWYFYGTRLYREDFKTKNNKKKSVWQVICFTEDDWFQLNKKFKKSTAKCERELHRTLSENFLPELPRLFREKERLARKRLLENQPRRTSRRLRKENTTEKEEVTCESPKTNPLEEEERQRKRDLEIKRKEAYERSNRLKEQSEDSQSEDSEVRYEMGGTKTRQKKSKGRQRKLSTSSSNSKDASSAPKSSKRKKTGEETSKSSTSSATTTVGRQTNNSLAAATGQIVIQPVTNSHKKKLKTSQVFRQTDEDLITGMHKILDYVKNHEDAWPFADPVDEDYAPNYYTVIRKPMDLQRMEERLDAGYYKNFAKFRDDFQLIVDNCRLYNGVENEYTEMVDNLLKVFERATEKFLDQISSSDDEIAVEFPNTDLDAKDTKKNNKPESKSSKRKPTLAAKTDKKREHSPSEESLGKRSLSCDSLIEEDEKISSNKKDKNTKKTNKVAKKDKNDTKKNTRDKKNSNSKHKKEKFSSPLRSRSPSRSVSRDSFRRSYSSSPPPSSVPSSPDNRFDFFPKKHKSFEDKDSDTHSGPKGKQKQKQDDTNTCDTSAKKQNDKPVTSPSKPKDKHNKLRETIEKLKAKSEISNKLNDDEFRFDLDTFKENKEKSKKDDKSRKKKDKVTKPHLKKDLDFEDSNSTMESLHTTDNKKKKTNTKNCKNASIDALTIATEQTLKDINKWLDDTPKYSEFSSASNSPCYPPLDDFDIVNKIDNDPRKKVEKFNSKKDGIGKDIKRRTFSRDPAKFLKRREVQRTIDRLQPGKSKGNLISSVQSSKQTDELFPLGPLSKNKDTKNSLIVKTDDNAPKLSLGSVLDSFGRHKFVDDTKQDESENATKKDEKFSISTEIKEETQIKPKLEDVKKESPVREESSMMSGATPNLSAWFKAFGAPKIQSSQKKSEKSEGKESEKTDDSKVDPKSKEEAKVPVPEHSPSTDSPVATHGQPVPRQRKVSTGSSISERSSFSQDMDSPRVGIDERLGAYPAPYPSPMHRSPSGASPVMASPRPDVSPKAAPYPPFNGQIRVGFYQDTVSNKSSPDKSCSPRDNPQSPYAQCSEHVYTPNTTQNMPYTYPNSPYYSHTPNYSNTNPTPPYNPDSVNPPSYYDTNKSLTDQYQAKNIQNYVNSPNNVQSPSPHPPIETFRQEDQNQNKVNEKMVQSAMFPVKKRAYNESDSAQMSHRYEEVNRNIQPMEGQNTQNVDTMHMNAREESMKHYIHQNIPDPKPLTVQTNVSPQQQLASPIINYSTPSNPYNNYSNESNYPLNILSRSLASTPGIERKLDIGKYTNMGYSGPEVNFPRGMQQYSRSELSYARPPSNDQQPVSNQGQQPSEVLHYSNASPHMGYKNVDMNAATSNPQQAHTNYTNTSVHSNPNRLGQPLDVQSSYKSNEVSIPRPTYNTHIDMDQPLGLRGNIANLSHIVDRYNNDERMLTGLQPAASQYYGDKGLGGPHMFNKPICTSSSGLPIFNQPNMIQSYNQNMQVPTSSMYNRQMTELQNPMSGEAKNANVAQQGSEKKSKKRKSAKTAQAASASEPPAQANNQGFQSYAGLKSTSPMEPSAISLKTASVVPGSAFNFGPSPSALGIGSGLYGDKDAYPNFLEDFRAAPNYYIAAATAAHHRSTPDAPDKQTRVAAHQSSARQAPSYPFIGARQATPPSYPLSSHFMPSAQAPLMDASSPLYQHYLQAGVLNQGLLGPPGPYPPGYHPALSMRQPYDSMTRPPWL
ncbi:uncharacterized protein dikar [Tribolium castaneum]|uniref:Bromo domain-containing protein n=1 Tax=Tribolium castaneum TaxID=7070 RepID=D6WGY8_TRICA|nr:PREDICTED: uncharacterized protein LOC662985 isoform X1 [Tribolium castaneum]EFA00137.2 hypothetical protein TcasGA2_TC002957 [Tribolium castaneum]|eukprot:XP_008190937.1 PREDICTED: uncharacterized protein LOC662985 isoform X1 [Tribolium castaneum]